MYPTTSSIMLSSLSAVSSTGSGALTGSHALSGSMASWSSSWNRSSWSASESSCACKLLVDANCALRILVITTCSSSSSSSSNTMSSHRISTSTCRSRSTTPSSSGSRSTAPSGDSARAKAHCRYVTCMCLGMRLWGMWRSSRGVRALLPTGASASMRRRLSSTTPCTSDARAATSGSFARASGGTNDFTSISIQATMQPPLADIRCRANSLMYLPILAEHIHRFTRNTCCNIASCARSSMLDTFMLNTFITTRSSLDSSLSARGRKRSSKSLYPEQSPPSLDAINRRLR
mmetsp:Transcript_26657/g.50660  ORF Transcript_26657/g.50660 Transcript_26657/m.50660 type:complete len:290 (+) Transcript_26657:1462-2331(+)